MNRSTCSVVDCGSPSRALGLCVKHYQRFKKTGTTERTIPTLKEKLFANIEEVNGCWVWQGAPLANGYGRYNYKKRDWLVHRLMYTVVYGPIPPRMYVCHKCDVRLCINPAHLFLGTHQDNMDDMVAKGRHQPAPQRGEASGMAKLSDAKVLAMRSLYKDGVGPARLSKQFDVSVSTVKRVVYGWSWKHLP